MTGIVYAGMTKRRFPPPWSVDDPNMKLGQDCYIVRDGSAPISDTGKSSARGPGA